MTKATTPGKPAAPANAGRKQGARFQRGRSGNPAGKRPGTKHRTTILAEKIMQDDAAEVVRKVVDAAKDGGMRAAHLVLERVVPVRKGRLIRMPLPAINSAADLPIAIGAVITAMSDGVVTPEEALTVAGVL